jgi:hypothetical protein
MNVFNSKSSNVFVGSRNLSYFLRDLLFKKNNERLILKMNEEKFLAKNFANICKDNHFLRNRNHSDYLIQRLFLAFK